jgi:hypothetical protein
MEGGQSSTNLINGGPGGNGYAKKYMFSLENLAWRTSSTPGFSVSDLAMCERGPNGGRVMWFAPYGLTFSESVSTNWNSSEFLGRPEPIYTYRNTSRTGSLSWKIVVDHPSVLNVIVDKVLGNETNRVRIDSIIDSFFAGCRKYDLYELAKKYYTIKPGELSYLQEVISSKDMTKEELIFAKQTIQTGNNAPTAGATTTAQSTLNSEDFFKKYVQVGGYFGNDFPKPKTTPNYTEEYTRYTSAENKKIYTDKSNGAQLGTFFNAVVTPNYNTLKELTVELDKQLTQYPTGNITIVIDSSCSAPATVAYNVELSKRRIESIIKFFNETESLKKYITAQRLILTPGKPAGEETTTQVKQFDDKTKTFIDGAVVNCTDKDVNTPGGDTQAGSKDIFTTQAMACRRAYIKSITGTLTAPVPTPVPETQEVLVGNVVTSTVKVPVVEQVRRERNNVTKRVLRSLLSECDYFETIKAETPMVYDNLKDKLKFFQPAFHSTTPEGLNTRLTFLQQCMRPGDTIPTVKQNTPQSKPTLEYNNAVNTSFGAPPVLVLRVGDFYNTKITPTNLSIQYEQLDINPEGIGIQPMIANITMAFNFVGGSGLKESVDKLQNALTFNYYANTEMYDDRSDVTAQEDFLKILDSEFLKQDSLIGPPTLNQGTPNAGQNNNSTVGTIITNVINEQGETGTLSYSDFMVQVVNDTQTYFTTVVNKTKETVNQYNNAVRQQWMIERSYTQGNLSVADPAVVLFGKPSNIEKRFDGIFSDFEKDIDNGGDPFIEFISLKNKNFSQKLIRTVKQNYFNFVKNKRSSFQNAISKITQELTTAEQGYLQTLGRVNLITFEGVTGKGTDGYQGKTGNVRVYVTTGTDKVSTNSNAANTYQELRNDIRKVQTNIGEFNTAIWSDSSFSYGKGNYTGNLVYETATNGKAITKEVTIENVFVPFSKNTLIVDNKAFKRQYMIVSDDVLDEKKYQMFKDALISNVQGNKTLIGDGAENIEAVFDAYWIIKAKPVFAEENNITKDFIDNLEKTKLKDFLKYTPFDKKERVLTYTIENGASDDKKKAQENMIKGLGATTNSNTNNNTWNNENGATGAYTSKAKLN